MGYSNTDERINNTHELLLSCAIDNLCLSSRYESSKRQINHLHLCLKEFGFGLLPSYRFNEILPTVPFANKLSKRDSHGQTSYTSFRFQWNWYSYSFHHVPLCPSEVTKAICLFSVYQHPAGFESRINNEMFIDSHKLYLLAHADTIE